MKIPGVDAHIWEIVMQLIATQMYKMNQSEWIWEKKRSFCHFANETYIYILWTKRGSYNVNVHICAKLSVLFQMNLLYSIESDHCETDLVLFILFETISITELRTKAKRQAFELCCGYAWNFLVHHMYLLTCECQTKNKLNMKSNR